MSPRGSEVGLGIGDSGGVCSSLGVPLVLGDVSVVACPGVAIARALRSGGGVSPGGGCGVGDSAVVRESVVNLVGCF